MKIIAATGPEKILVEMTTSEMQTITEYNWKPSCDGPYSSKIDLRSFRSGEEIPLPEIFAHAKELLETFRGIAPGLRQQAERLSRLAAEVQLHEPKYTLLPKADA